MIFVDLGRLKTPIFYQLILIIGILLTPADSSARETKNAVQLQKPTAHNNIDTIHVTGKISNTLYVDARARGIPASVIHEFISIMNGTVDFTRDIHRNDKFEMTYIVTRNKSGKIVETGPLLHAGLKLEAKNHSFYRFERGKNRGSYYSQDGRSLHVNLKTSPLPSPFMTSAFGKRSHPISGKWKKHEGVDFSAPSGTPIFATADGTITQKKYDGSYGKKFEVKHARNYVTTYAHMKDFAPNLKVGSTVRRGQMIGYVGSTGRSTGPHLHYEVRIGARRVDPIVVQKHSDWNLIGSETAAFKEVRQRIDKLRGQDDTEDLNAKTLPVAP